MKRRHATKFSAGSNPIESNIRLLADGKTHLYYYYFLYPYTLIIKNECHSNIIVDRLQGCGEWWCTFVHRRINTKYDKIQKNKSSARYIEIRIWNSFPQRLKSVSDLNCIIVANTVISLSDKIKNLDITLDPNLNMELHTKAFSKSWFYHIRSFRQICSSLDDAVAASVASTHVSSRLIRWTTFLPRDAMHKRGLCRHAVSVCLSLSLCVCLSRSWIMSKRIKIS